MTTQHDAQAALATLAGFVAARPDPSPVVSPMLPGPPMAGLSLVLAEEFTGPLDPKRWGSGEPWDGAPGVGMGPDSFMPLPLPPGLIEVSGGSLNLHAVPASIPGGRRLLSGFVTTRPTPTRPGFTFTHGYVEARVSVAQAAGLWSAFWLLGNGVGPLNGWPACGEVDIFEVLTAVAPNTPYRTDHWVGLLGMGGPNGADHQQHTVGDSPGQPWPTAMPAGWQTFGLLRTSDQLVTYLNGQATSTTTRDTPNGDGQKPGSAIFDLPSHVRFDLSAGNWDQPASAVAPGVFSVDYLRVWSLA